MSNHLDLFFEVSDGQSFRFNPCLGLLSGDGESPLAPASKEFFFTPSRADWWENRRSSTTHKIRISIQTYDNKNLDFKATNNFSRTSEKKKFLII